MAQMTKNIVEVRDAYKRYASNAVILKGLNMTVQRGTIYAFLGPSGCGKTTLLKCIIGRYNLDAGEIFVGVKDKSDIGYMPQETALLEELTIKETISYYGWMFSIKTRDLTKKTEELITFLELPPENCVIRNLSGGQKRRVSLCIALLHSPKLLILDEPTVGVDPVLSHRIWKNLLEMSTIENKTIILTTHYIEEARHGNTVGMMREGVLLVEGEPPSVMAQFGCDTLEDVFLQLSHKQVATVSFPDTKAIENYPRPSVKPKPPFAENSQFSFNHLFANIIKNVYFLKRSTMVLLLLFANPVLQCLIYEFIVDEPKGLKIGIVNDEVLNSQYDCNLFSNVTCFPSSCMYTAALEKKKIELIPYKDIHDAHSDAEKNRIWGFLYISPNFTESLHYRIINVKNITDDILEQSEITVSMDMSNQYISSSLKRNIIHSFFDYLDALHNRCSWEVGHLKLPIHLHDPVYGTPNPKFADFSVVGLLILLIFFLPVSYSMATLKDKLEGVQERNLISGMTNLEIILGHATITLLIFVVQTFFMMFILFCLYHHQLNGSYIIALLLILLIGLSGMCFGYVVAIACDRDTTALYLSLGVFIALANLSGMFWPTEGMHYLLRSVSWILPLAPASDAFRGIATRSWSLTHPVVYTGFISVIGYILLMCGVIYLLTILKRRN